MREISLTCFIPGLYNAPDAELNGHLSGSSLLKIDAEPNDGVRRALDLCAGTGSASKVLRDHGYQVISVDIDPQWGAPK